ncbi:MAG: hypothetical protein QOI88_3366 [Gammaproteobacteria bacterium]|jgi:hypothetical protein|nr:hypothetical protein [Gammaproteobacteria bacterium]
MASFDPATLGSQATGYGLPTVYAPAPVPVRLASDPASIQFYEPNFRRGTNVDVPNSSGAPAGRWPSSSGAP